MLIHFLEAWSLLGAVHFICQHILEVWLIIGLCLTKIYSMPCIQPYTFWGIEIWLLYGPLQVPCLEAWLLIRTCLLIGTKESYLFKPIKKGSKKSSFMEIWRNHWGYVPLDHWTFSLKINLFCKIMVKNLLIWGTYKNNTFLRMNHVIANTWFWCLIGSFVNIFFPV